MEVCSLFSDLLPKIWESCIGSLALGSLVGDSGEQVFRSQGSPPVLSVAFGYSQASLFQTS